MRLRLLTVLCAVSTMIGCGCLGGGGLPTNPPAYVDNVYASEAGADGISIYYILADANGQQTTSDGYVSIKISDKSGTLFTGGKNVTASEFGKYKVGQGAFEHEAILQNIGRLTLRREPSGSVDVVITFTTPEGEDLTGKTTTYY